MNRRFSSEQVHWPEKRCIPSDNVHEENGAQKGPLQISAFRITAPQILASTAKNLLLLDLGMTISFATIVIPVLLEGRDTEGIKFNAEEASWFSSVNFICQSVGSMLSGAITEPLGRKNSMMLINLPHFLGWLLFYFSQNKVHLYVSAVIMGLGIGFMQAPIMTYIDEISQPHLRRTFISYSNLFVTFGMMLIYLIGNLVDWRTAAAISASVPIINFFAISQVPETPIWLMARGRKEDAEKALCWLRGWVSPEHVKKEFEEIVRYTETTMFKSTTSGIINPDFVSDNDTSPHQNGKGFDQLTFTEKVKDLARPGMMKPLGLIVAFFFFGSFTGAISTKPYMVLIADELHMPLEPLRATLIFGAVSFSGSVMCMVTIAKFKKRPISLCSMFVACLSAFCIYIFTEPWMVFVSYIALTFATYYGAIGLVWTLVGEIFPFRGRGVVSGWAASLSYLIFFLATKTFQSLRDIFGLRGTFLFYGGISAIGTIFLYFLMPETEGRTLEDIERQYEKKPPLTEANKPSHIV